jgi:hypothetical protein
MVLFQIKHSQEKALGKIFFLNEDKNQPLILLQKQL